MGKGYHINWDGNDLILDPLQRCIYVKNSRGEAGIMLSVPGFPCMQIIHTEGAEICWAFNGDVYKPTISPSVLSNIVWGAKP